VEGFYKYGNELSMSIKNRNFKKDPVPWSYLWKLAVNIIFGECCQGDETHFTEIT
jgi:hypothetical protein